jgi:hypothetical protein
MATRTCAERLDPGDGVVGARVVEHDDVEAVLDRVERREAPFDVARGVPGDDQGGDAVHLSPDRLRRRRAPEADRSRR